MSRWAGELVTKGSKQTGVNIAQVTDAERRAAINLSILLLVSCLAAYSFAHLPPTLRPPHPLPVSLTMRSSTWCCDSTSERMPCVAWW